MLVWVLWNKINNRVWNNMKEQPGQQLGIKAIRMWEEWAAVQTDRNSGKNQDLEGLSVMSMRDSIMALVRRAWDGVLETIHGNLSWPEHLGSKGNTLTFKVKLLLYLKP
jgi:hypothetical protein